MIAVPPVSGVTTPPLLTVAVDDVPELHVPPGAASERDTSVPTQAIGPPVIEEGIGATVIPMLAKQPPGSI